MKKTLFTIIAAMAVFSVVSCDPSILGFGNNKEPSTDTPSEEYQYKEGIVTVRLMNPDQMTSTSAVINGMLSVEGMDVNDKGVFIYYSNVQSTLGDLVFSGEKKEATLTSGEVFFAELTGLETGKVYYYMAEAVVNGTLYYSDVAFFTAQETSTTPSTALDSDGTANSYIVSAPGTFSFSAILKGSSGKGIDGTPASAEVLWESFGSTQAPNVGDIISKVSLEGNRVVLSTPETLMDGNALIAVKDAFGTILWSWHIWVCAGFNPELTAQTYANDAGVMMDRNLGALDAVVGSNKSIGLLYQWGRKDPFMGCAVLGQEELAEATPSLPKPIPMTESVKYSIEHPTLFISFSSFDWNSEDDNQRWSNYGKTMYDPCPPGWKVPTGGPKGFYARAFGGSSAVSSSPYWDYDAKGAILPPSVSGDYSWYPAGGDRGWEDARLCGSGEDVQVYSSRYGSGYAGYTFAVMRGYVYPSTDCTTESAYDYFHCVDGRAVRCAKESTDPGLDPEEDPMNNPKEDPDNNPEEGNEDPYTGNGINVLYYGCQVFEYSHADIDIYCSNMINYIDSYGIYELKTNWASAVCEYDGCIFDLEATDGWSGNNYSVNSKYGKYSFIWAFQNDYIMNALQQASADRPVKITMTDVRGNQYVFMYTEPQTDDYSFYKYQP